MTRKRDENEFEIQPITPMPTIASKAILTPFTPERAQNKEERWIQDEWRKRMAIMQAIIIEAKYAHDADAYLELHSMSTFSQTANYLFEIKSEDRPEVLQPYIDKFFKRTLEDLATRQLGINEVSVTNIAYTIHRDHYPPELENENKSWLARLFGS